ncbi:thiamine biosynthesis lipoprotein [Pedococcus dokdonensis]|uniref:FAD:protein FMN transferase n=1 Tax=Pedococcus dokdonensis TaxID=443156 RepID=A0A1H0M3C1_9MICO|nr:FAD:protein FMN transferase [Pedococcus dokdonensis]SDO74887.1 thiamine biosynthesis lipoprotein [Pedococcus dokdonensis]
MSAVITRAPHPQVTTGARRAFVEQVMGLPVSVHVRGDVERPELLTAVQQVWGVLHRVDAVFSTWRTDSELMRRRRGELAPELAHPWLSEVDRLCLEAEQRTGGLFSAAFDGAHHDPTGLVKGWAVERAARHLRHVPGISWCVNAGGDLLAGAGRDAAPSQWLIGVEDPRAQGAVVATVALRSGGLATSGAAARGAHVVDPRSGVAIDRDGSATVWGPSLLWADVWATALYVDPPVGAAALEGADPAYRSLVL